MEISIEQAKSEGWSKSREGLGHDTHWVAEDYELANPRDYSPYLMKDPQQFRGQAWWFKPAIGNNGNLPNPHEWRAQPAKMEPVTVTIKIETQVDACLRKGWFYGSSRIAGDRAGVYEVYQPFTGERMRTKLGAASIFRQGWLYKQGCTPKLPKRRAKGEEKPPHRQFKKHEWYWVLERPLRFEGYGKGGVLMFSPPTQIVNPSLVGAHIPREKVVAS